MKKKVFEQIDDSCGDLSLDDTNHDEGWVNSLASKEYDPGAEHPTPEMLLIRQAVKFLTPKQRAVWEYHAYDKLTQDKIAKKLHKDQSTIARTIQAAERRIAKWCKSNMGAYELLKSDFARLD